MIDTQAGLLDNTAWRNHVFSPRQLKSNSSVNMAVMFKLVPDYLYNKKYNV
ncbi:hypothetical protein [Methylotenera sp. G11]|uniref:hypothetical protein n=1 Tax=Methylotenera sp. G11 TaxID=1506585 RepID=UPI000A8C2513|nr:hypothetical protein [Methylotenera sp. G11]